MISEDTWCCFLVGGTEAGAMPLLLVDLVRLGV